MTVQTKMAVQVICERAAGATSILPGYLSNKAVAELQKLCASVSLSIEKYGDKLAGYTKEIEATANGDFAKVSKSTKTEVADLVVSKMRQHGYGQRTSAVPRVVEGPDPQSAVAKTGATLLNVQIPFRSASHTDIHLIVDGDFTRLVQGGDAVNGVAVDVTKDIKVSPTSGSLQLEGTIRVDTTARTPGARTYLGLIWNF